jgi:hypothetical protein
MSPKYDWACKLCSATNAAGALACSRCGFSASASANEVDAARSALGVLKPLAEQPSFDTELVEPASFSERLIRGVLLTILIVGALLGKFAPPIWLNIVGLLLASVALVGLWGVGWIRKGEKSHV